MSASKHRRQIHQTFPDRKAEPKARHRRAKNRPRRGGLEPTARDWETDTETRQPTVPPCHEPAASNTRPSEDPFLETPQGPAEDSRDSVDQSALPDADPRPQPDNPPSHHQEPRNADQCGFAASLEPTQSPEKRKRDYVVSARVIAANRANSARSTGPVTPEGKAAVRFNALKHGIRAAHAVIDKGDGAESLEEFDSLMQSHVADLQPETDHERALVARIVLALWRKRRALRFEISTIRENLDHAGSARELDPQDPDSLHAHQVRLDAARIRLADIEQLATFLGDKPDLDSPAVLMKVSHLLNLIAQDVGCPRYLDSFDWPFMPTPPLKPPYMIEPAPGGLPQNLGHDQSAEWLFRENFARWRLKLDLFGYDVQKLPERVVARNNQCLAEARENVRNLEIDLSAWQRCNDLRKDRQTGRNLLPDRDNTLLLVRYEARLDNDYYRALAELHREQDRRAARNRAHSPDPTGHPQSTPAEPNP